MISPLAALALGWPIVAGIVEIEAIRRSVLRGRARAGSEPSDAPDAARAARVLLVRPCAGRDL